MHGDDNEASSSGLVFFLWVHGYLGNRSTFGAFPKDIAKSFRAENVFIEYEFSGSFEDAVKQVAEGVANHVAAVQGTNVEVVLCAHSMGGLIVAELMKRKLVPKICAVCLYDVPFGGISPEYVEFVGNTSVSEALGHVLPESLRQNAETMHKMMKLLGNIASDFARTTSEDIRARAFSIHETENKDGNLPDGDPALTRQRSSSISELKSTDVVDAKEKIASLHRELEEAEETEHKCNQHATESAKYLMSGPLLPLMQHYGEYLKPLLQEHGNFVRVAFDEEALAAWRTHMASVHAAADVTVLHIRVAQGGDGQAECFRYLDFPETESWKNCTVDLKVTTNPFAPLMAHTSLFSNHSSEVWHETYWFMKHHMELQENRKMPWLVRMLPSTSTLSIIVVVLCILAHLIWGAASQQNVTFSSR